MADNKEHQSRDFGLLDLLYPEHEKLVAKDILVVHSFECAYLLAFENKVTYVTDDIEMARKFEEEVINNFAFGFNDKVYFVTDWKKVDFSDLDATCSTNLYSSKFDDVEEKDDDAWAKVFEDDEE